MSGIACIMHERGHQVTGSDLKESRFTRVLSEAGVPVTIGHDAACIGDARVVVVSTAVSERNPELIEAKARGIEIWQRAKMLAWLAGDSTTVAVAGTHGKTSTSAMVATMLEGAGANPTFVVGGEVVKFGRNAMNGAGPHYVVEADESDGSFMHLTPSVALVTNVEADHLDHYGSLEAVERTFVDFLSRVPASGVIIACADDSRLLELASGADAKILSYGFAPNAAVRCHSLTPKGMGFEFIIDFPDGSRQEIFLPVPGEHMVQNATGALAVAYHLAIDIEAAARAVETYRGVKRRFDRIGQANDITIYDDYAHHPTEVKATLKAARDCGFSRICAVFQPHRYTRTEAFAQEFGDAFGDADHLILMDVYSAGEPPIPGVSGKTLVDSVLEAYPRHRVTYLPHRTDVSVYLAKKLRPGDVLMTMGAGDVSGIGVDVLRLLEEQGSLQCR